jgi:hypothetical protein
MPSPRLVGNMCCNRMLRSLTQECPFALGFGPTRDYGPGGADNCSWELYALTGRLGGPSTAGLPRLLRRSFPGSLGRYGLIGRTAGHGHTGRVHALGITRTGSGQATWPSSPHSTAGQSDEYQAEQRDLQQDPHEVSPRKPNFKHLDSYGHSARAQPQLQQSRCAAYFNRVYWCPLMTRGKEPCSGPRRFMRDRLAAAVGSHLG